MLNRELVDSKKISKDLIGNWLLWFVILQFCFIVIYGLILKVNDLNNVLLIVIALILQAIAMFFIFKISTSKTFKEKMILDEDAPVIMKNLSILVIIVFLLISIYNFSNIEKTINKIINTDKELQLIDNFAKITYSEEDLKNYYEQKDNAIEDVKNELYVYEVIFHFFLFIIYCIMLLIEKNTLYNYVSIGKSENQIV